MAMNAKNGRIYAFILMILLSFGLAVCLAFSFPTQFLTQFKQPSQNTHEILSLQEARSSYETEIQQSIQTMLDTWLGEGRTKVSVHADMDFAQKEQTQELLDLDNPALSKAVGDEVEYTYSKETISSLSKSGQVKHLSIAVLIDSQKIKLSDTLRDDIQRLVERASGFNANRKDSLDIIETTFASAPVFSSSVWQPSLFIFFVILLFVLFGVIMTKNGQLAQQIEPLPTVLPAFTNPAVVNSVAVPSAVEGQVAPNALKKAQNLLQSNPDETLTLLRGWLCQSEGEVNEH